MTDGYPITLLLAHQRCVVVGGGAVATRKVSGLLDAGAVVTVIAPQIADELQILAASGEIDVKVRETSPADIRDAFLVIVATDQYDANERISRGAQQAGESVPCRRIVVDYEYSVCEPHAPRVVPKQKSVYSTLVV